MSLDRTDIGSGDAQGVPVADLQARLACIPLLHTMQVEVRQADAAVVRLVAPLASNVNDKGCAFGGSLAALMTVAGWGLVEVNLMRGGVQAEVFVADSTLKYLLPVWEQLDVLAEVADGGDWGAFMHALVLHGRARISLEARAVLADGRVAATLHGRYVAICSDKVASSSQ